MTFAISVPALTGQFATALVKQFPLLPDTVPLLYLGILTIVSLYGFHKIVMIWRFYRHRETPPVTRRYSETELPKVTVQLPIFNEMYVAERLLEAVTRLDYPTEKLEIQVLDDSTDETQNICQQAVERLQALQPNMRYIQRTHRTGYKAGALAHGLEIATGELVLIFDADFIPAPNMLRQLIHHFADPQVGMVQSRWSHVNRRYSLLTEIQAMMLDGHFIIEQTARSRSGCFFNFNGTAGIWRIQAVKAAGGWQHTTVTEDLDLSYRVQLQGWKCLYLPEVVVPAELPVEMNSFKSQQFRWAKGASQVAKQMLGTIFQAKLPLYVKAEALLHLTNNINYCLLLVLLLLSLPYQIYITQHSWNYGLLVYVPIFLSTTISLLSFYWVAQQTQQTRSSNWRFGYHIFWLMSIGIGLSLSQSLAVCDGLLRTNNQFVRTPKHGVTRSGDSWSDKKYRANKTWILLFEFLMLLYLGFTAVFALSQAHYLSLPFLLIFVTGYGYVLSLGVFQRH